MICRILSVSVFLSPILAQSSGFVPPKYGSSPGNDALSMPLRWHQGMMQVLLKGGVLPSKMPTANLKEVVLRRPITLGEPAYPALTRTFTVRLASATLNVSQLEQDMGKNQGFVGALTAVASNRTFNIPATSGPAYTSAVGKDLVRVPFAQPFSFAGPDLFLEWTTTSASPGPSPFGWVDALMFPGSGDHGVAVPLGQGGCSSLSPPGLPMTLEASGEVPSSDTTITLRWRDAHPNSVAFLFGGAKLLTQRTGSGSQRVYSPILTFLRTLARPGCHFWTEPMFVAGTRTDALGNLNQSLKIPKLAPGDFGSRYVLQGAVTPTGAPIELTNGLALFVGSAGVQDRAGMVLSPRTFDLDSSGKRIPPTSPWPVFESSLPVLQFFW